MILNIKLDFHKATFIAILIIQKFMNPKVRNILPHFFVSLWHSLGGGCMLQDLQITCRSMS